MLFWLLALGLCPGLTGCGTTQANVSKTRGIYTTLALVDCALDLPASGYTSYRSFSAGQNPAAVVVGYGDYPGLQTVQQPFTLELIELGSGTVLMSEEAAAVYGKATVIPLAIRKSGNYELKLLIHDDVYDTWDFSVSRETGATNAASTPTAYAKGDISAMLAPAESKDQFTEYDNTLLPVILNAASKERDNVSQDLFAQRLRGSVSLRFNEDKTGQLSAVTVVDKTLSDDLVQFFKHALENGAPYPAWPAGIHHAPVRTLTCTFFFD